jgi:hypothetical protein
LSHHLNTKKYYLEIQKFNYTEYLFLKKKNILHNLTPYLKLLTYKIKYNSLKKIENDYLRRRFSLLRMLDEKLVTKGEFAVISNKLYTNLIQKLRKLRIGNKIDLPKQEELNNIEYVKDNGNDNVWEKSSEMHEVLLYLSKERIITKDDFKNLISRLNQDFINDFKNRRNENGY